MTTQSLRPEIIEKLEAAVYPSFAMLAGMQLDLFTPLADGPMSVEELAQALGVGSTKLEPLLYSLVAAGLLTEEGERFYNTPESDHFLVSGKPTFQGERHKGFSSHWDATLKTAESISAGAAQAKLDFHDMTPEQEESLYRGSHPATLADGRMLPNRYDFSTYRSLLDLGGGSGGIAIGVTEECPHIHATVGDLPEVVPISQRFVDEATTRDRLSVMSADFLSGSMSGSFDAVVMKNIIQVLSKEQARVALKNTFKVIAPEGDLYILGRVLDDNHLSPENALNGNLFFLNIYDGGQAYTEQLHRDWLAEAGFGSVERTTSSNGRSIIVSHKPS